MAGFARLDPGEQKLESTSSLEWRTQREADSLDWALTWTTTYSAEVVIVKTILEKHFNYFFYFLFFFL